MTKEKEMIGFCGYNCDLCAARSDDPAIRQKLVDGWRKFFGHEMYTVDNVKCGGCKGEEKIADTQCPVRPCAMEKGLTTTCVECDDFPCQNVSKLLCTQDGMLFRCCSKTDHLTEEEFEISMKQFVSVPNLIREMIANGKLPDWVQKYYE